MPSKAVLTPSEIIHINEAGITLLRKMKDHRIMVWVFFNMVQSDVEIDRL